MIKRLEDIYLLITVVLAVKTIAKYLDTFFFQVHNLQLASQLIKSMPNYVIPSSTPQCH